MKKLLLIIDPQVDFICGTLAVPGAESALNTLADYILVNNGMYVHKIITADRHPYNHCSFIDDGGMWPRHCVHDTVGAAIWQPVFDAAYQTYGDVTVLHKGQESDIEEYSIFKNPESAEMIERLIDKFDIDQIDLCGLAGDVCVCDTLKDGMKRYGSHFFNVLTEYSPSIDGGKTLNLIIEENNIKKGM